MKVYVFSAALVAVVILFAYYIGVHDGNNKCNMQHADNIVVQQTELIKLQGDINAETVNTAVGDIRRILREKYTIAE